MKRVLLTITLITALSVFAEHEYIPFIKEGKVWVDYDNQKNNWQVGINGDIAIIDGIEYHTLHVESFNNWNNEVSLKTGSKTHGYVREDNKKVYLRGLDNGKEYLLYDFGVQEGDTIDCTDVVNEFGACLDHKIVVDSIKTTINNGKERNVYYVTCIEQLSYSDGRDFSPTYISDVWVEGIGSIELPYMYILSDKYRWGAEDRLEFKYFYDYNTREVYPHTEVPFPHFSYPGTASEPEHGQNIHEYIPFVEEGKVWVEYNYMENYSQVGIYGCTTIDQKEYHNLYIEEFSLYGGVQTPTSSSKLHGYIREDDKKVYLRGLDNETEYLIYDFSIHVGDTVDWTDPLYPSKRSIVVDSIKTVTYYGKEHNVYYVSCLEEFDGSLHWGGKDVWIEGVGTQEYPIFFCCDDRYRWGASGMTYFKYCYDYNTQKIFPTTTTPYSAFSYPAPASVDIIEWEKYSLTLHCEGDVLVAVFPAVGAGEVVMLYDATGRVVATQPLRQGATTATIDISHLPQGIYIAHMANGASRKVVL